MKLNQDARLIGHDVAFVVASGHAFKAFRYSSIEMTTCRSPLIGQSAMVD